MFNIFVYLESLLWPNEYHGWPLCAVAGIELLFDVLCAYSYSRPRLSIVSNIHPIDAEQSVWTNANIFAEWIEEREGKNWLKTASLSLLSDQMDFFCNDTIDERLPTLRLFPFTVYRWHQQSYELPYNIKLCLCAYNFKQIILCILPLNPHMPIHINCQYSLHFFLFSLRKWHCAAPFNSFCMQN